MASELTRTASGKHVALLIEVPAIYTDDLDELRAYRDEHESESDWLLNCINISGPVRLRAEVAGEKDFEIIEVWGQIREAQLVEPDPGYEADEPALTDDQLRVVGGHKMLRDERACDWCAFDLLSLRRSTDG